MKPNGMSKEQMDLAILDLQTKGRTVVGKTWGDKFEYVKQITAKDELLNTNLDAEAVALLYIKAAGVA